MKLGDISTIAQHSNSVHAADVKSAALGTNDEDEARALLLRAGVSGLQRAAGYVPAVMTADNKKVPSIFAGYREPRVLQEFWPDLFAAEFDSGITNAKFLFNFWRAFDNAGRLWSRHPRWHELNAAEERFRVTWRLFIVRADTIQQYRSNGWNKRSARAARREVEFIIRLACKDDLLIEYGSLGTFQFVNGYSQYWQTLEQIVFSWIK